MEGVSGPGLEVPHITADHILFVRTQLLGYVYLLGHLANVVSLHAQEPRGEGLGKKLACLCHPISSLYGGGVL